MSDGFHLAVYSLTTAAAQTLGDLAAVPDPVIGQRNSHLTITDPLQLLAAYAGSTSPTEAVIKSPTLNAQTIFNIDPVEASLTHLSPPRVMDLWDFRPTIPQYEEIQMQMSDPLATANTLTAAMFLATPGWNRNIPKGVGPLAVFSAKVSVTVTLLANAWSALTQLTFEQGLRSGWYSVVGSRWYIPSGLFFRYLFARSTLYNGRAMRPGDLCSQAFGDLSWNQHAYQFSPSGVWGSFHTFELPQIEVYSGAAVASATYQGRLYLVKISDSTNAGFPVS